jgi:hypothetical protein
VNGAAPTAGTPCGVIVRARTVAHVERLVQHVMHGLSPLGVRTHLDPDRGSVAGAPTGLMGGLVFPCDTLSLLSTTIKATAHGPGSVLAVASASVVCSGGRLGNAMPTDLAPAAREKQPHHLKWRGAKRTTDRIF